LKLQVAYLTKKYAEGLAGGSVIWADAKVVEKPQTRSELKNLLEATWAQLCSALLCASKTAAVFLALVWKAGDLF